MSNGVVSPTLDDLLTTGEVASRLKVTRQTVLNWFANGDLRGTRLSSRVARFAPGDIEEFINRGRATNARPESHA
jgi:excisionase family DNA binding protein